MDERTLRILEFDKIKAKLISHASSELGKELAEAIVPLTDFEVVSALLKETDDGVAYIVRKGSPPLGGLHDIRGSLKRVELESILGPGELMRIGDVLRVCRNLKGYVGDNIIGDRNNIVNSYIAMLQPDRRIEDKIRNAILSEEEIADQASPLLGDLRRKIKDQQNSIKDRLNEIMHSSKYQKYMQDAIVTMRGDRYVVPVKQEHRADFPGLVHDASSSGATVFIEPMAVVEANNTIRALKAREQAEIERILYELSAEVGTIAVSLTSNVTLLAKLDFIFAKARLSTELKCVCPKLNMDNRVHIKNARHPLLAAKTVVPIDLWIGKDFKTLVITGPNTGGKTVTLKTVGLFTLMAQAGLHLPANEGTEVCIFNKIFADIGDEQSIEQSLSTFSSHMTNIVGILEKADDRSLVLFDELGAGTDPTEGAALAMSILECLHQTGTVTIATTHYSELKVYAVTTVGVENACCEFDVETLRPTYRLLIGVPGKSNAFAISKRLGLKDPVIDRAREFLTGEELKFEDLLMSIEKNRSEAEKDRIKAQAMRREIEDLKNELDGQRSKLNEQKEKLLREAREEARMVLTRAKAEADELLQEMRRIEQDHETALRNKAAEELRTKFKSKINTLEDSMSHAVIQKQGYVKAAKNLKPGDSVLIVSMNQKGIVISPPDKNGDALIQAGIMKINIHVTNLKIIDEQKKEFQRYGAGKLADVKSRSVGLELDLRGFSLEEALDSVDKYLDDAAISGLHEVTIIHGKGTGILRAGIHKHLKSHQHVKSFRLGKYGEGETGVTVVELA